MPEQFDLPLLPPASSPDGGAGQGEPRRLTVGDRIVPYALRRSRRRTIGLTVDHRGLTVSAPVRATLRDIEGLLRRHEAWIVDKLDQWRQRRRPELLTVADGLRLPCLGGELLLRLSAAAGARSRSRWEYPTPPAEAAPADTAAPLAILWLEAAATAQPRALLESALRAEAKRHFSERLALYAARLGLTPPPLSLSSARTRWGSCSRTGIRLNWRLIHFTPAVVDYVVAHELAHLKEMNHSPRFWAVVEQLYPDYRAARQSLKTQAASCPQW